MPLRGQLKDLIKSVLDEIFTTTTSPLLLPEDHMLVLPPHTGRPIGRHHSTLALITARKTKIC